MSALDELAEDEAFQKLQEGALDLLAKMDDPQEIKGLLDSGKYQEALDAIEMEGEEVETRLELMKVLADSIGEQNPELMGRLESELEER